MGDLKPLGSEKLQGMDKIKRILEISKFNESTPSPINETSKSEYKLTLADGNTYEIVREKAGYIIKQSISESQLDYIAPIQDRKYYKSYSQALKRLNLMAKEMNEIHDNPNGVSLFSEQKKFVLKTPQKKSPSPAEDVENVPPPPPPSPAPPSPAIPPEASSEEPLPGDSELPEPKSAEELGISDEDMGMPDTDMEMPGEEDMDEHVTFKTIQKLTGKLGQKLRNFASKEENEMSSKDIKYVVNSILSALDLSKLEEDDREEIMGKFDIESSEEEPSLDMGDEESSEMPEPSEEPEMSSELGEESGTWTDLATEIVGKTQATMSNPLQFYEEDETSHVKKIADSIFSESKIEDILLQYFEVSDNEKKFINEINSDREKKIKRKLNFYKKEIERLSENKIQEIKAKKFLFENKSANLIGRTNKNSLVFQLGETEVKVTPKGIIQ